MAATAQHACNPIKELRDDLQAEVVAGRLPGAVVLFAKRNHPSCQAVEGFSNVADRRLRSSDIFRLYSMSKPIMSVAIMRMVEEGKLSLDDSAAKYLPEFANLRVYAGGDLDDMTTIPVERDITIRDLLTHTSGLTYHFGGATPVHQYYRIHGVMRDTPVGRRAEDGSPATSLDDLVARLGHAPLLFQPGARFEYSTSTTVLGAIAERVTGLKLDRVLDLYVFDPLDMVDTGFFIDGPDVDRFVTNYTATANGIAVSETPATSDYLHHDRLLDGGGALAGTAHDYLRFAQMLANRGVLDGVRLLRPASVDLLLSPYVTAHSAGRTFAFGLGFELGSATSDSAGWLPNGAAGWAGSANTFFWVQPDRGEAVVFMTQVLTPGDFGERTARFRRMVNTTADAIFAAAD